VQDKNERTIERKQIFSSALQACKKLCFRSREKYQGTTLAFSPRVSAASDGLRSRAERLLSRVNRPKMSLLLTAVGWRAAPAFGAERPKQLPLIFFRSLFHPDN
jgi:hypothetical protein